MQRYLLMKHKGMKINLLDDICRAPAGALQISVNETQRNENKFTAGDIIWNLSTNQLQLWNGKQWVNLYVGTERGVEGLTGLGELSVSTNGATTIKIL